MPQVKNKSDGVLGETMFSNPDDVLKHVRADPDLYASVLENVRAESDDEVEPKLRHDCVPEFQDFDDLSDWDAENSPLLKRRGGNVAASPHMRLSGATKEAATRNTSSLTQTSRGQVGGTGG